MLTVVQPAYVSDGRKTAESALLAAQGLLWRGSCLDEATKEPHPCMAVVSHPHCQRLLDEFFSGDYAGSPACICMPRFRMH